MSAPARPSTLLRVALGWQHPEEERLVYCPVCWLLRACATTSSGNGDPAEGRLLVAPHPCPAQGGGLCPGARAAVTDEGRR